MRSEEGQDGYYTRGISDGLRDRWRNSCNPPKVICGHEDKNRIDVHHNAINVVMDIPDCKNNRPKTLSRVDIAIVKNDQVLALCEVEENPDPEPKLIIGDICSLLLADKIEYDNDTPSINSAKIFLSIYTTKGGKKDKQAAFIENRIAERITTAKGRIHIIIEHDQNALVEKTINEIFDYINNLGLVH